MFNSVNDAIVGHPHQVANRYYRLECTHFMSSLGGDMLAILARDHLWMRVLSSASVMEPEV